MLKYFILLTYILVMIGTGIYSSLKVKNSGDFLVAGNRGNVWQITGSLLATILGSSAILGSSDLAFTQGWAAAWMILTGAMGLFLLVFLAPLVKRQGKYTLPQLIGDHYGVEAKVIASFVIPIAWIGIIAAQMIGGAKVMNSFFGWPYGWSVVGIGSLVERHQVLDLLGQGTAIFAFLHVDLFHLALEFLKLGLEGGE